MNYKQLTNGERYQIKAYFQVGLTIKAIVRHLGRNLSTISREIKPARFKRVSPYASQ